ncbi:isoprenylcysteine carboxylmethyltransferase family protein, partial [Enterococcus faecalis]
GKYWTVKLIFADKHTLNTNWLFKHIKHPNYFLNIIPELIGVTLVFHAWYTLLILLMPYGICLYLRIREENQLLANLK